MQVEDGPVVGEAETLRNQGIFAGSAAHRILRVIERDRLIIATCGLGGRPGAHHGGVDRDEQVTACAGGQQVAEQDAYRPVLLGDDGRAKIVSWASSLAVTAQCGWGQVRVHLLGVLDQLDFVVVCSGVSGRVRDGDRDILAEVIGCTSAQAGQLVDELLHAAHNHGVLTREVEHLRSEGVGARLGVDRVLGAAERERRILKWLRYGVVG